MSFVTPHTHAVMNKYREMGKDEMPIAFVFGVPPAYEIMANFSGLHMDLWGEMEMVGTIMDMDVEMVPCETIDLTVPAHAEIVVEGLVNLRETHDVGGGGDQKQKPEGNPRRTEATRTRSNRFRRSETCHQWRTRTRRRKKNRSGVAKS